MTWMSSAMVSRSLENRAGSMTRPIYSSALLTMTMPGREPSANSRRVAAMVVVEGTLPASGRIIRSTVRLRSQPTSLALRIVSPRRCRRQVENEWPNMKRTQIEVTMQPASTTALDIAGYLQHQERHRQRPADDGDPDCRHAPQHADH